MKTFKWTMIKFAHLFGGDYKHTLLEMFTDNDGLECIHFWAILDPIEDGFSPIIFNKSRTGYMTLMEILSLEDARLAVEKELLGRGTMDEGDLVIYEGDEDDG